MCVYSLFIRRSIFSFFLRQETINQKKKKKKQKNVTAIINDDEWMRYISHYH